MDQVGPPDKINFHKQASEILYSDLLNSYLSKTRMEEKVIMLAEQIKREKVASKGWKTQVKKLEADLVNLSLVQQRRSQIKSSLKKRINLLKAYRRILKEFPQIILKQRK